MNCPVCDHPRTSHYAGTDYVGCHTPVRLPKQRGVIIYEKRKGLTPCPCRLTEFDDPVIPAGEQGSLW